MIYSALIEVWEQTSAYDKRFIVREFGSFGSWMNANLKQLGVK